MRADFACRRGRHLAPSGSKRGRPGVWLGVFFLAMVFGSVPARAVDPESIVRSAIDTLQSSEQAFPAFAPQLQRAIASLEASLALADGSPLFVDSCHVLPPPEGTRSFDGARSAVIEIEGILHPSTGDDDSDSDDDSDDGGPPPPPSLAFVLEGVLEEILDTYQFLADAAIQEARALAPGDDDDSDDSDADEAVEEAEEDFATGLARRSQGSLASAMSSFRSAWLEAQEAIPPAPAGLGDLPILAIQSPVDGAVLSSSPIAVAGMVQDITAGTLNGDDVEITINGVAATVANRSFQATGIVLREGLNAILAVATDADGNRVTACIAVSLDTRPRPRVSEVSGNFQSAPIFSSLPEPLVVRVTDDFGSPVPGATVVFRVIQGNGSVEGGERAVVATTDATGEASTPFTLGSRSGVSVNRVRATAVGFAGEVIFSALATVDAAASINPVSGDNQRGAVGQLLARPLVVVVTDGGQNPVAGEQVLFQVLAGGGAVDGGDSATVVTDTDGRASVTFALGPDEGFDNNLVEAGFVGLANEPVTFKASGFVIGDPADTRLSGVVLDNQGLAVPGATLSVRDTALTTTTDAEGQFTLFGVPVGPIVLAVDPSTTSRPGVWATLDFDLETLPGIENTLEKPIYILPLDVENGKIVGGDEPVTVDLPEVPGFSLTVLPRSATFPDGSSTGLLTVTAVHADKIPMAPGMGMQPRIIVTVQPAGVHFDPPAPVTYPNVDALAPGTVTELFSFDHDVGEFVSIGTGTVSEDGLTVASDPGFGIVKAGWHCAAPQSGGGASATLTISITNEDAVKLCVNKPGRESDVLEALGSPPRDSVYTWETSDASVVKLIPSGGGLCPDATRCTTLATGLAEGMATATATITCTTTGESASDSVGVEVEELEEFEIVYRTFIPFNNVEGPFFARCGGIPGQQLYFSGDDRGFSAGPASFRSQSKVTVIPEESCEEDGLKDGTDRNFVGETKSYAEDALADGKIDSADDDGVLNDCHLLHDRATASSSGMNIQVQRLDEHKVQVRLFGGVGNPLVTSPDIDWDFTITIETSGSSAQWTLTGSHDGFPSHEIYIDGTPILQFAPSGPGDINLLFPPLDEDVNKSGTLP